jgi:hypothetical protein
MQLIESQELKDFCNKIKLHNFNQGAKLCGLDLANGYENFKLYIELPHVPSLEVLNEFLPEKFSHSFLHYSKYWDPYRSSSLALGFKIDNSLISKNYFHIKFDKSFKEILYNNNLSFLSLLKIDPTLLEKGISYEIESEEKYYDKFYVYVKNEIDIAKVMSVKFKNTDIKIEEIEELEIYATSKKYKINIVNKMNNFEIKQNVWNSIPEIYHSKVKEYSSYLNSEPVYTGFTKDKICSVYFSLTNKKENVLNI